MRSKISKFSRSTRSTKSSKSKKSTKTAEAADDRQDMNNVVPTLDTEVREEIFFINTITTSSGSTEEDEDEVSNISFDGNEFMEQTNTLKQYVIDHLLGCVDFIEECTLRMKDTQCREKVDEGATCVASLESGSQTQTCMVQTDPVPPVRIQDKMFSSATEELENANPELINDRLQSTTTTKSEIQAAPTNSNRPERSTADASTAKVMSLNSNDLESAAHDVNMIPISDYEHVVPKSPYETIALKSNNDYFLAATNIDAIIDSHVAHLCEEMCVCGELGMCGDDDISQFRESPLVSDNHENMLFQ